MLNILRQTVLWLSFSLTLGGHHFDIDTLQYVNDSEPEDGGRPNHPPITQEDRKPKIEIIEYGPDPSQGDWWELDHPSITQDDRKPDIEIIEYVPEPSQKDGGEPGHTPISQDVTIVSELNEDVDSVVGTFDLRKRLADSVLEIVKKSKDIMNELGYGPKTITVLFDRACGECDLQIQCFNSVIEHPWVPVPPGEALILKFTMESALRWSYLGSSGWRCRYRDDHAEREVEGAEFGKQDSQNPTFLIRIKKDKIIGVDVESKRVDLLYPVSLW